MKTAWPSPDAAAAYGSYYAAHTTNGDWHARGNVALVSECRRRYSAASVARMGQHRLPRQLLSSWVYNPRPRGAPLMTFGRSISKDLQEAGVEIDGWYEVAQNRALWREVVRHLAPPDETKNNDPHNQATTSP